MWFPRPERPEDLRILDPAGGWEVESLFELLRDQFAVEWRHKVGVAGRNDGSGKTTTRLLASSGWVLKTNLDQAGESAAGVEARMIEVRTRAWSAGVWHPSKVWALMRAPGADGPPWYPVTLCRELRTLRTLQSTESRMRMWQGMIDLGLRTFASHGIGLDLNPANFAVELPGSTLYYLDDEVYPDLSAHQLAQAIVGRVPEEPEADESRWRDWGQGLRPVLERSATGELQSALIEGCLLYPVPDAFASRRAALVDGIRGPSRAVAGARTQERSRGGLTCVLADVHSNAAALDAVIGEADRLGARSFLFLGDAVGYGPSPRQCVERLASLPSALCIRGNHDQAIASGHFEHGMNRLARASAAWTRAQLGEQHLKWLAELPLDHVEDAWMAVHGAPKDPHRFLAYVYDLTYEENLANIAAREIRVCFYGHTHVPMVHAELPAGTSKLAGVTDLELRPIGRFLVNPGSVGQPRDGDVRAAFALWDRDAGRVTFHRIVYPLELTVDALRRAELPEELASRLERGA